MQRSENIREVHRRTIFIFFDILKINEMFLGKHLTYYCNHDNCLLLRKEVIPYCNDKFKTLKCINRQELNYAHVYLNATC